MKPKARFYFGQLLKLGAGAACLFGSVVVCRILLGQGTFIASSLGEAAASPLRRAAIFAAAVSSYWAFVHFYERRPVVELSPRWRWTLLAAVAGAASIGLTIVFLYATGRYQLVGFRGFDGVAGLLVIIAIAAILEELAFRALLFRILEETVGTTAGLLASAVVFSVVHLTNHGVHAITPLTVTLGGLMWAGLYIISRNVWVTAAHHACWNATIFLIGVPLSGEDWTSQAPWQTTVRGSGLWTGGPFGPEDSLFNILVMALICALLVWIAKRRGRWNPGPFRPVAGRAAPACPGAHA
ncbi:MAG TPA: type II CAAX endopeptidase family protein, partial [Verrucomicrobiae bacterium]|nr:type II CAAX endopeptidase family protein [Verrucomicrobiae bacterium]